MRIKRLLLDYAWHIYGNRRRMQAAGPGPKPWGR